MISIWKRWTGRVSSTFTRTPSKAKAVRRRAHLRPVALVGVVVMALAACSGGGGADAENSAQTKDTLRIALSSFGNEQLDIVEEAGQVASNILLPMYDSLLEIGKDSSIQPGLAESWNTSEDGLTWTFKIRDGVQFHGGYGELTARDVVFSIKRWMDPASQSTEGPTLREKIKSLDAPDDRTVVIKTNGVQVDLAYYFAPQQANSGTVMSEKYLTEGGTSGFAAQNAKMNEKPIGTGPFQFVSRQRGQKVVFEAVSNHWRAKPAMKRLEFLLVPEPATQVAMLQSGQADIIEATSENVESIESSGNEVRSIKDAMGIALLFTGTYRPPAQKKATSDANVRHALSMAIDRKTILKQVLGGHGTMPDTPFDTVASSSAIDPDHYKKIAAEWQRYDPEAAKKMLADAGYANGFDGVKMITFTRPGAAFLPQLGEIIASQWAEVGVKTPIVAIDYGNFRPHFVQTKDSDTFNAGDVSPYNQATRFEAVDLLRTYYQDDEGFIRAVRNPDLDALIRKAAAEQDEEARTELVSQAFDIVHAEWTIVPLFRVDALYGVNSETVGAWHTFPGWGFLGRMIETIEP
ncbi:MAG: hypothetical protein GEV10_27080 [Streptosporangiales bacterium]|nr:hypothetical protein [Streptosporangiales bacterium]